MALTSPAISLMWPERVGSEQSVALLDSQANWWCKLTEVGYMCPLDLHHLMDAFRITAELSSAHLREIAVQQLGLLEEEVTADCQVSMDAARRKVWVEVNHSSPQPSQLQCVSYLHTHPSLLGQGVLLLYTHHYGVLLDAWQLHH